MTEIIEQIHQAAKALSAETGLTIKPGYIGNCGPGFDYRCWMVWINNARLDVNNNQLTVGPSVSTEGLAELLEALTLDGVKAALARPGSHPCAVRGGLDGAIVVTREESVALIAGLV